MPRPGSSSRHERYPPSFSSDDGHRSFQLCHCPPSRVGKPGQTPPSEKLHLAGIGVGGMGQKQRSGVLGREYRGALRRGCQLRGQGVRRLSEGNRLSRFPPTLERQKDVEAVIVATPDHTHAPIAMAAMRAGKHVYVQKPLTHSVFEARALTEAARQYKVISQMGSQGHSGDGTREVCEWVASGVLGAIREVNVWTNRPVWPQGIEVDRPKDTPPVPAGLDGPVARPGAATALPSLLPAGHLARLVRFRHRRPGGHGLSLARCAVLGA